MKKLVLFLGLFLGSTLGFAQDDKVGSALTTVLSETSFVATLKDGFHFNEQAPNQIIVDGKGVKPKSAKAHELLFQLPSKKYASGRASLYICDDAQTFCQPKSIEFEASHESASPKAASLASSKKVTKNEFGFIEDNLQAASDQAKKEKKLILLDFSARWCPGCIRLENEVFGTKAFKTATKGFITVRLDYDRFENLTLAGQYNVHVIPSLLVLTADREEISRAVDFQPMTFLGSFLSDAKTNPLPFAELEKKADTGDKDATLALGRRLYSGFQFERSAKYLEKVQPAPIELADARVQAAKESAEKDPKKK